MFTEHITKFNQEYLQAPNLFLFQFDTHLWKQLKNKEYQIGFSKAKQTQRKIKLFIFERMSKVNFILIPEWM